jgi:hypothetical protein
MIPVNARWNASDWRTERQEQLIYLRSRNRSGNLQDECLAEVRLGGAVVQGAFSPGSLVRARGRDWIVLPGREPSVLHLRPLMRGQADEIGIYLPLEGRQIASAEFVPPAAATPGDATGVMTLFNAARLTQGRACHRGHHRVN